MESKFCIRRSGWGLAMGVAMMLAAAELMAQAGGQLTMGPSLLGTQVLTGPNPEDDPNFPGASGKVTVPSLGDVSWTRHQGPVLDWHQAGDPGFGVNIPQVMLPRLPEGRPPGSADYLGFIEGEGSLLEIGPKGAIYEFNAGAHTLARRYDNADSIPADVLAALRNRKYIYESSQDRLEVLTDAVKEANDTPPPAAPKPYEWDANLAGTPGDSFPLTWDTNRTSFQVKLPQAQPVAGMYLGFNERGSWIASALGKLYLWNLADRTLEEVSDDWWDAPLDLRNPSAVTQAMIYYRQHQYRAAAMRSQGQDPNLPPNMANFSRLFFAIIWEFQGNDLTRPLVYLGAGSPDIYLGFDERGTWVQNQYGGVYAWSFRTWRLELMARDLKHVPKAALVRLHNPDPMVTRAELGQ